MSSENFSTRIAAARPPFKNVLGLCFCCLKAAKGGGWRYSRKSGALENASRMCALRAVRRAISIVRCRRGGLGATIFSAIAANVEGGVVQVVGNATLDGLIGVAAFNTEYVRDSPAENTYKDVRCWGSPYCRNSSPTYRRRMTCPWLVAPTIGRNVSSRSDARAYGIWRTHFYG